MSGTGIFRGCCFMLLIWAAASIAFSQKSVKYACGANTTLTATFSDDGEGVAISVNTVKLASAESASGARYSDGVNTFWTKGSGATFSLENCTEAAAPIQSTLQGTSWRLVSFQGGDDTVLKPTTGAEYIVNFESGGKVTARINCNQGSGSWSPAGPNRIKLGSMAMTMMMCPAPGGVDRIGRDWQDIVSYVFKDGRLFLSLRADGGIYEFEPLLKSAKVTGTVTYRERMALPNDAVIEVKLLDVSRADAVAEVIGEQTIVAAGKQVPFRFEIPYDPAKIDQRFRYAVQARILVGGNLLFTNTSAYQVITENNPSNVDIIVVRSGR